MSVDRSPQVGDTFRWVGGSAQVKTVTAVTDNGVLYEWLDGRQASGTTVSGWRKEAVLVAPRPTVTDHWGCLTDGRFIFQNDENAARDHMAFGHGEAHVLARVINGRVCDERGVPFETRS